MITDFRSSHEPPRIRASSDTLSHTQKGHTVWYVLFVVGRGGFEPPKSKTSDLQSDPFGRSGICPYMILSVGVLWSRWLDSNPQPADYKSAALPLSYTGVCLVPWGGIEPPTGRFSVCCSTDWATKANVATQNGLEPSTSSVTGWRSNQLSYWAIAISTLKQVLVYNNLF